MNIFQSWFLNFAEQRLCISIINSSKFLDIIIEENISLYLFDKKLSICHHEQVYINELPIL